MFSYTSDPNADFLTKKGCFFSTPTMNIKDVDQVPAEQDEKTIGSSLSGWWFGTFLIFHSIWDNPSH
jgi:hypothetical protein